MGEVISMATPTGGTSKVTVKQGTGAGISLSFERVLADGDIRSEVLVGMSVRHARLLAAEILRVTEGIA